MPQTEPDRKLRKRARERPFYANVVLSDQGRRMYSTFSRDLPELIRLARTINSGVIEIAQAHSGKPPVWVRPDNEELGMAQLKAHEKWLATIKEHYGSLDAFEDATTVRTMRRMLSDDIAQIEGFYEKSQDNEAALEGLKEVFEHERGALIRHRDALNQWLAKRGLKV